MMTFFSNTTVSRAVIPAALSLVLALAVAAAPARAQTVLTAVNGDPVTTTDVDEYSKLLKLMHKPASRSDALEAVIADRIKYDEARKWGVEFVDSDFQSALARLAAAAKMQPEALVVAAQKEKIDIDILKGHLRAQAAWNVYVRNLNKTMGATDEEVSAQIAQQGTNAKITDYNLRQIVFVLPVKPTAADVEGKMRAAQALRTRFTDCESGLPLARGLPDVAVKEPLTRASDSLSQAMRTVLADTPRGHLTAPQRSTSGVEMIAVCNKSEDSDPTTLRERVQKEVIQNKLQSESERLYQQLRKSAIISKN